MSKLIDINKSNINQIYQLYKDEFINSCENILIENQNEFLDKFYEKMNLIIKSKYGENIFNKIPSLYLIQKQCENKFITDIYWPMHEQCLASKKNFYSNYSNINNYLINFRPHCLYDQVPLHICGSKFIQVFDKNENNNNKKVIYVICSGCNKCYYSKSIIINCHYCQVNFYSEVIDNAKNKLFIATWKKYHCNNNNLLINEQMHCVVCDDLLYINNNRLYCKKCAQYFDPEGIIWTCKICNIKFKSDIKIYNPYEFKEIIVAKKYAFLFKKISKPSYLPCNCIPRNDIQNYNFHHESNIKCKGVLYYHSINNKKYLVCSLCDNIFELKKFFWTCPLCSKKFLTNEIKINNENNNKENIKYENINTSGILVKKRIRNSCSQKVIETEKNKNKIIKNKKGSYIKKRINSSFVKKNSFDISIDKIDNNNKNEQLSLNKRKLLLMNHDLSNNNSSNKDLNSISNKYNMASTAYSSFMNNNNINSNIKEVQTDRNNINSFLVKKEKTNKENKHKINKYINKKILDYPLINNSATNRKIYLKSKYKTIEQYINEFNYNEKSDNKYLNTSEKSIHKEKNMNDDKEGFINFIKKTFKKSRKNKNKENSFYSTINVNKSFVSQKTDINQIYFPKKHIHSSSVPSISTSPLYQQKKIKYNNSVDKRNIINSELNYSKISQFKIYSGVKQVSKNNINNNILDDIMCTKIRNRKRNSQNFIQNLTENSKGSSNFTFDEKEKKKKNNDISFKNYIKTQNYDKNNKERKSIYTIKNSKNNQNSYLKLNIDEISNNTNMNNTGRNKYKNKTNNYKNIYLTNSNNTKNKKENNINKSKNIINKKIKQNKTKPLVTENPKNRNSKRSSLIDLISHLNNNANKKNSSNSKDKNKINQNNNVNHLKESNNSKDKENQDELKVFNFEEYKIITQLGQGSFGKIYLVQNANNELYTMKKLIYSEELDVQAVIKEYKMCYKLKHPNVVKILGIFSKKLDKTTYVVYVLMEVGLTDWEKEIKSHIEKKNFYTEKELLHIMNQLITVLSFLQKNNISHRDIKPQNILVFKNNIYKIADFGEAKQIENINSNFISNSLRGTELYMSPLLFNGLRTGQIDIRHNIFKSDVYSLGLCILFAASLLSKSLYDIRKFMDMNEIRNYLNNILKNKYSKNFIDLVGLMLEIHEKNRPDFIQLEEIMKKWDNDIN